MTFRITALTARQILDSRGNPTVEVEAQTATNRVRALVPSGASTGVFEAKELRDGGKAWKGKGVTKAVHNVSVIARAVVGKDFADLASFDARLRELDGTADKSKLGANALLGCSMAATKLLAADAGESVYETIARTAGTKPSLPVPYANVLNGGKHAGTGMPIQECMIVPKATKFVDAVEAVAVTYHELKQSIVAKYGGAATGVGDEGGFAPPVATVDEALSLLRDAAKRSGKPLAFALDAAASEFYSETAKTYQLGTSLTADALRTKYLALIKEYGIVSLEDPFEQHAFNDFATLRAEVKRARRTCQIVGDDLTVTNPARIAQAIEAGSCDTLLLKVNQIGTITEALAAAKAARDAGWTVMVSHRSGETEDAFISHLAVGLGTGQIKLGAPCRGERTAKYNELLRIAEHVRRYGSAA